MKVIEEHRQVIVKTLRRCKIQLQRPEKESAVKSFIDHKRLLVETAIDQSRRDFAQFANKYLTV